MVETYDDEQIFGGPWEDDVDQINIAQCDVILYYYAPLLANSFHGLAAVISNLRLIADLWLNLQQ